MASIYSSAAPLLNVDVFSEDSLRAPFQDYRRLRDAGAVVRLARPDVHAIGRFVDVREALRASDVLISGQGVGFNDMFNAPKGMNVIQSDGDIHKRMRAAVIRPITPAALKDARADLKDLFAARLRSLMGQGWFDAMDGLASFLPVQAVSHLVGLPTAGRERMLQWAAAAFNLIGPNQDVSDVVQMKEAVAYLATLDEDVVRNGSWAGELFAAAGSGRLSLPEAMGAMSAYIIPSLDTTILANGHLLFNLARHPDQWRLLQENPDMIPSAVLENLRHSSPIRWFSRIAATDYNAGSVHMPKGARVMLLYGCANRDERHYDRPDEFDLTRDARDHLAWGTGPHMCAGMHMAKIEMEVMLEALVEAGVTLEAGEPVMGTNAGLYGFGEIPFRVDAALG